MAEFVDCVKVTVIAGNGGDGCFSVRRLKHQAFAGVDGGSGGRGGDVFFRANSSKNTLQEFRRNRVIRASNGKIGQGSNRNGADGSDVFVDVPVGTIVRSDAGNILADLTKSGSTHMVAHGGIGGFGNRALSSPRYPYPHFALLGEPGEKKELILELKCLAQVCLVGFPSAGKSSIISAISSAKPKIAAYPFTTLIPQLGVVEVDDYSFSVADVPGLISGASQGKGLGHDFLRHIDRCLVIVHVLDLFPYDRDPDPINDYRIILEEIDKYQQTVDNSHQLSGYIPINKRKRIVLLNKVDLVDPNRVEKLTQWFLRNAIECFPVSALTKQGLQDVKYALKDNVGQLCVANDDQVGDYIYPELYDNRANKSESITVIPIEKNNEIYYQVKGKYPLRWVQQTNFSNPEAVEYLSSRFNRAGVEDLLEQVGAAPGSTVVVGEFPHQVYFQWFPQKL